MTRSTFRSLRTAVVSGGLTLAFSTVALAQDTAVPPATTETVPPPAPVTDVPPAAPVVVGPSPVAVPPAPVAPPAAPAPVEEAAPAEEEDKPWYSDFSVGAFVDAYGAIRSDSNQKRQPAEGATVAGPVGPGHEAYVQANGFALAFAGVDLAYSGEKLGATISLRFGPGINRFYAADNGPLGIDNLVQAFATYKPTDKLTIDLGQFYTIYGAEVTESWRNVNYSRGALYYSMQPFWHTGLRANYKINDVLALNGMVVNGVNSAFEGNKSPSLGIQAILTPSDALTLAVGYLGGLHPRNGDDETAVTANFENFFDVAATVTAGGFKVVGNFDYNLYTPAGSDDKENFWGISVAPAYYFNDYFGIGARVEYLQDSANSQLLIPGQEGQKVKLTTLTGTLDIKPVPGNLFLRPEFRYEIAGDDDYAKRDGDPTDKFWSVHLGAVVTSMP